MAQIKNSITGAMEWITPLGSGSVSIRRTGDDLLIRFGGDGVSSMVWLRDLAEAVCLVRDLEHALDTLQPGLFFPLPPNDPSEIDAIATHAKADMIERGIK